jgi:hypothetical protein
MYSKFKLDATTNTQMFINNYYEYGLKNNVSPSSIKIKRKIESCIDYVNHRIDGDKLEKELFKEIQADIFLSHSHADEKLAIALAGWFEKELGLTAFVDSCVWDHVKIVLEELNNEYNLIRTESNGSKTYDHGKANYIASHLYLMLNSALNNMLDKTECLIFINTENSTMPLKQEGSKQQTSSPWIYSEVVMANTMRQTKPERPNVLKHSQRAVAEMNEQVTITHKLDLKGFISINMNSLINWAKEKVDNEHPLDTLYKKICNQESIEWIQEIY